LKRAAAMPIPEYERLQPSCFASALNVARIAAVSVLPASTRLSVSSFSRSPVPRAADTDRDAPAPSAAPSLPTSLKADEVTGKPLQNAGSRNDKSLPPRQGVEQPIGLFGGSPLAGGFDCGRPRLRRPGAIHRAIGAPPDGEFSERARSHFARLKSFCTTMLRSSGIHGRTCGQAASSARTGSQPSRLMFIKFNKWPVARASHSARWWVARQRRS
jgi:hypothetical protein